MTGYGRAAAESARMRVAASVRAVNHRYLDLAVRLPEELRELEAELRSLVDDKLARGRVELKVHAEMLEAADVEVTLDDDLAAELLDAVAALDHPALGDRPLDRADLLQRSEVLRVRRAPVELEAEDRELVRSTVDGALDAVVAMRQAEGSQVAAALERSLAALRELAARLGAEQGPVRERLLEAMARRVGELVDQRVEIGDDRLAQEVAILAEKIDVQEELDRLSGHLDHFAETMEGSGPIGRRLDFLAQEIHRELNTLGAKCRDLDMGRWVIDSKVACEQMREQLQNVE